MGSEYLSGDLMGLAFGGLGGWEKWGKRIGDGGDGKTGDWILIFDFMYRWKRVGFVFLIQILYMGSKQNESKTFPPFITEGDGERVRERDRHYPT